MKLTFYGHACFAVEAGGSRILFDPFISGNPKAAHIDLGSVKADYILLSHGHGDHIADAVQLAKQNDAQCVANFEIANWLNAQGIEKAHPMAQGGRWKFGFGTVQYTNAIHSSSFPDGSYAGNPGGFILTTADGTFYFAGDTALTYDMKIYGEQNDFDFVVLPIGDNFTMGYEDAATAAKWLGAKTCVGVHYDTFGFIEINQDDAKKAFSAQGCTLLLPGIGDTIDVG